ncbi:GHMP kinase [Desulfurococcaceae archaeon MEX13E-LK6-19]|nr:GHMP kinase [Desulfurococcaceae archaeon MEX13E-LK6-19]
MRAIKFFKEYFGETPHKIVSVPGRLDFLNTHQDYKGLPVVSIGVNLRCFTAIAKSSSDRSIVVSFNLRIYRKKYYDVFSVKNIGSIEKKLFSNYLKSCVKVLIDSGYRLEEFKAGIYSDVPIGAGMASSAALTTSFIGALNSLFNLGLSRKDIAEYAYKAEHDVLGIPCGRLDQYGCVYGNISLINTKPPYNVEQLPKLEGVFVVLDSGIKHSTAKIHPRRQEEINTGLRLLLTQNIPDSLRRKLGYNYWEPEWGSLSLEELAPYLSKLPPTPRKRIVFTIKMHKSTIEALKILRGNAVDHDFLEEAVSTVRQFLQEEVSLENKEELIGLIMTYQHILLKELYDVSLPILDKLVIESIKAGAYGAKLSGAGLGGVVIALARDYNVAKNIIKKASIIGARQAWIVEVDDGIKEHQIEKILL